MTSQRGDFDVVVIGGGPTGENVADRAVKGGLTAALVETERVGGECSFWACIPSKALLRPGHALAAARRLPGARDAAGERIVTRPVFGRRDELVENWDDAGQVEWAAGAGITVIRGRGRLVGERQVLVTDDQGGTSELTARHAVVICTGSTPWVPPIEGLAEAPKWISRDATSASEAPGRLAILGGGAVGVEMAQAWARLGSAVTLVVGDQRPLVRFEPFVGDMIASSLRADGVTLALGTTARRVSQANGEIKVELADGTGVRADTLLVATGRRPATRDLGLDAIGLDPDSALHVDDAGCVTEVDGRWLYAAGDVTGRAPLTHQGKYAARAIGDVIAARARGDAAAINPMPWSAFVATADHTAVPQVIFTDPEVATVGMTAASAEQVGIQTRVVDEDISVAGASIHAENYRGRVRMVVDESRRVIVGVTFVGYDVAELLHAGTVAVAGEVPLDRLWHAVPAFPTVSEVWLRLLESYGL